MHDTERVNNLKMTKLEEEGIQTKKTLETLAEEVYATKSVCSSLFSLSSFSPVMYFALSPPLLFSPLSLLSSLHSPSSLLSSLLCCYSLSH